MLTLITPTGDRPQPFALCEYWMSRQTYTGDIQWIVVDDGIKKTCPTRGQHYIRRMPKPSDPSHTLGLNLLEALPHVRGDKVLIIEDDDYYSPEYLETMSRWLDTADLTGERGAKYYYLMSRAFYFWDDHQHASLCRTGFKASAVPQMMETITKGRRGNPSIDMEFWERFRGQKQLHETSIDQKALCVGIKQLPGRPGITHKRYQQAKDDSGLAVFKRWVGSDFPAYKRFLTAADDFVHYTVLIGGYDTLGEAPTENSYVICEEHAEVPDSWKAIRIARSQKTDRLESRLWKMRPDFKFPGKATLYTDASMTFLQHPRKLVAYLSSQNKSAEVVQFRHEKSKTIRDEIEEIVRLKFSDRNQVDTQLTRRHEKMPVGLGGCLFRTPTPGAVEFGCQWWDLYNRGYNRDQVILPIALKESGAIYQMVDTPMTDWVRINSHNKRREKS